MLEVRRRKTTGVEEILENEENETETKTPSSEVPLLIDLSP